MEWVESKINIYDRKSNKLQRNCVVWKDFAIHDSPDGMTKLTHISSGNMIFKFKKSSDATEAAHRLADVAGWDKVQCSHCRQVSTFPESMREPVLKILNDYDGIKHDD